MKSQLAINTIIIIAIGIIVMLIILNAIIMRMGKTNQEINKNSNTCQPIGQCVIATQNCPPGTLRYPKGDKSCEEVNVITNKQGRGYSKTYRICCR